MLLMILAADAARTAGTIVGRLLIPILGVVLLVLGLRRRGRTTTEGGRRGGVLIGFGIALLVLGLAGLAVAVTTR